MTNAAGIAGGILVGALVGIGGTYAYHHAKQGRNATVVELDGLKYKDSDLPADIRSSLYDVRAEEHERENAIINQFALQLALARDKDKSAKIDSLPPLDQLVDVPAPTDQELQAVFDSNKSRLPPETTYEQLKPEIERYVKNQKLGETLRSKNAELLQKKRIVLLSPEPEAPQIDLKLESYPVKGNAASQNVVVAVADYLCPHCQESQPDVQAALKDFGDKFKFVAVPYSLKPDGLSGTLARGAFCALKQGQEAFWKYHDQAFTTGKDKGWHATDADNKDAAVEVAQTAGIDQAKIADCVSSPEAVAFVKSTVDQFQKAGVTGTPTFFMNGKRLSLGNKSLKETIQSRVQVQSH